MANVSIQKVEKVFEAKSRAVTALTEIDIEIRDAEFIAIVGASGCGKSTLLNLLAGFEAPTRGRVLVDGKEVTGPGPDRGVVFQHSALFPWLTVRQNVAFGLKLAVNKRRVVDNGRVDRIIDRVGLGAFHDHYPAQLSGGMKQRAAIASVLAIDPEVLLMDEPFGALDALTRTSMQDFLLEIWEENKKTVVLVTHDISEAIYLADRIVVMSAHPGRIQEVADVDLPRPRNTGTQELPVFHRLRKTITAIVRKEAERDTARSH